jgi:hypothetical protein
VVNQHHAGTKATKKQNAGTRCKNIKHVILRDNPYESRNPKTTRSQVAEEGFTEGASSETVTKLLGVNLHGTPESALFTQKKKFKAGYYYRP